ncbi:hypothetical protein INR49_031087 [Caranx melampygus]|nr:hypothetical protein INR49_031087 [Caranx melampygus]
MTHYYTDNWENVQNFQARPDDILIVAYPKAGKTWITYILDLLHFDQTSPECRKSLPILLRAPPLEAVIPPLQPGSSTIRKGTDLADNLSHLLDSLGLIFKSSLYQNHFGSKTAGLSTLPAMQRTTWCLFSTSSG